MGLRSHWRTAKCFEKLLPATLTCIFSLKITFKVQPTEKRRPMRGPIRIERRKGAKIVHGNKHLISVRRTKCSLTSSFLETFNLLVFTAHVSKSSLTIRLFQKLAWPAFEQGYLSRKTWPCLRSFIFLSLLYWKWSDGFYDAFNNRKTAWKVLSTIFYFLDICISLRFLHSKFLFLT